MQSRNQFLFALVPLADLPEDIEGECPICAEAFVDPVEVCPKHVFCQGCTIKWLTRRKRNTCPTCRRVLFDFNATDRWPFGADRLQILASAIERSGLLADHFHEYGYHEWTSSEVHSAVAAANRYFMEDHRAPITAASKAAIDIRILGPHAIAMGNLLRELARATNRRYSMYQVRDWKLIIARMLRTLSEMDQTILERDAVVFMASDLRTTTLMSLRGDGLDVFSTRFFEPDGAVDSPSGDLDFLIEYLVFQSVSDYERRVREEKEHKRSQQLALQNETSLIGWVLRWTKQRLLDRV